MIPVGLCQCGCGQTTTIAQQTRTADGIKVGQPTRYAVGHNRNIRVVISGEKWCRGCDQTKSNLEFAPDRRNRDGLQTRCKECKNGYARKHYDGHRAEWRKYFNAYRVANPEIYQRSHHRRRAKEREALGDYTPTQLQARIDFYGGQCYMCGCDWRALPKKDRTIDHVKPLACGGTNWPSNLRPACRSCNSRKAARCVVS